MIESKRLLLKPLTYEQLLKYIRLDNSLEMELGVASNLRTISADLQEALETHTLPMVADHSKNYLFFTLWTAISKENNKMVADICMLGEPNEVGEVEIGYGTQVEFQGQGFMTEIVATMLQWLQTQNHVKYITASTEKTNIASHKVLQKNGFIHTDNDDTMLYWKRINTNV